MKFPGEKNLNDIENAGCNGGLVAGALATMLFVPTSISLLPFLAIGGAAMFVGSFIGTNGGGGHSTTVEGAFIAGTSEVLAIGRMASKLSKIRENEFRIDIHGPHPEPCPVCGKWLIYPGESHFCNPIV